MHVCVAQAPAGRIERNTPAERRLHYQRHAAYDDQYH
jgi:hypothetical protein